MHVGSQCTPWNVKLRLGIRFCAQKRVVNQYLHRLCFTLTSFYNKAIVRSCVFHFIIKVGWICTCLDDFKFWCAYRKHKNKTRFYTKERYLTCKFMLTLSLGKKYFKKKPQNLWVFFVFLIFFFKAQSLNKFNASKTPPLIIQKRFLCFFGNAQI